MSSLSQTVENEILALTLADNVRARTLSGDGSYQRIEKQGKAHRSQFEFIALATGSENGTGKHTAKSKFPPVKVAERPF